MSTPRSPRDCPQTSADSRVSAKVPGHGAKSEAVREQAILALLSDKTLAAAARRCGVNERTLRRWMADDEEFKRELTEARRLMFQSGMNRVEALAVRAVDTLEDLLDAKKNPSVRLGAARTLVELGLHRHDPETILEKLDEVEAYQRRQEATVRR